MKFVSETKRIFYALISLTFHVPIAVSCTSKIFRPTLLLATFYFYNIKVGTPIICGCNSINWLYQENSLYAYWIMLHG